MRRWQEVGPWRAIGSRARAVLVCFVAIAPVGLAQQSKQVPKETVLYNFTGNADGEGPTAALIMDSSGNLYGTASFGGDATCKDNCGSVYKLDATGASTILHDFAGPPDGERPNSSLTLDSFGNLYGETCFGGVSKSCGSDGCGTVYKLDASGNESILHSFNGTDGACPTRGLTVDASGNFYGTTFGGGDHDRGVVFRMDVNGNETVLYSFTGGTDGSEPDGGVTRDSKGNLFGTTPGGGNLKVCRHAGCGVVFKLNRNGGLTVLHAFTGKRDGAAPHSILIQDKTGALYGTTFLSAHPCHSGGGCGSVFKLTPHGKLTVLHTFTWARKKEGANPFGGLVRDAEGNLFGTTVYGGGTEKICPPDGCGTVFKLDKAGKLTVLHRFEASFLADGNAPEAGLLMDSAGNLYGATEGGGNSQAAADGQMCLFLGCGTIFKLAP